MDAEKTKAYVDEQFDKTFVEALKGYVEIDNLTPAFDPEYLVSYKFIHLTMSFAHTFTVIKSLGKMSS